MKKTNAKKLISEILLVLAICALLVLGCVKLFISAKDINEYENRSAYKIAKFSIGTYLKGEFQDAIENALGDQIPAAEEMQKGYNVSLSKLSNALLSFATAHGGKSSKTGGESYILPPDDDGSGDDIIDPTKPAKYSIDISSLSKKELRELETFDFTLEELFPAPTFNTGEEYAYIAGMKLYKGHLMYGMYNLEKIKGGLDEQIANINSVAKANPKVNFYAFYLEKETDMDFLSGERNEIGNYIGERLELPEGHYSQYTLHSFEEYDNEFFKSDHHWNYKGSYRGYKILLNSLLPGTDPLEPIGEYKVGYTYGSKSMTELTASYHDDFYVYDFDFPEFKYYRNKKESDYYGKWQYFIEDARKGTEQRVSYASVYGDDAGNFVIDNQEDTGNGNILVIGTSYDNAVVKLLASHYDCLYVVDFRNYQDAVGSAFSLSKYIKDNNISTVLYFGDSVFYKSSTTFKTN